MDSDDIERMLVEIETGAPPTLLTPEADAMRAKLTKECADIRAKGGAVAIHHDIPDPNKNKPDRR